MDVEDYIKYYDNILTPQECNYIIQSEDDMKWKHFSYDKGGDKTEGTGSVNQTVSKSWITENHFLYDIVKSAFVKVTDLYSVDFPLLRYTETYEKYTNFRINKYTEGGFMTSHVDNIRKSHGQEYGFPQVSILLYINDDYEGGEFKIIDKVLKPKEGSAIIFPSNFMFPHESGEIIKGKKWSIVSWLM
tara:strand:- start:1898 stop:2461 length:564 start_codon:yes stop_codon:yes gene_type:complete